MSYIVKNDDKTFLISFSKVKNDEYMILATNLKQFYVQKGITSEYIQEQFNDSITRVMLKLPKIIKIIHEEEPANESELKVTGRTLNLVLKFQISLPKGLNDSFKINFELEECTSIPEISELFFTGLLKTIIEEKMKAEGTKKLSVNLPKFSFEANFKVNDSNISDLCQLIGGDVKSESANVEQKPVEQTKKQPSTRSTAPKAVKRQIELHNELKFEQLDESQEIVIPEIKEPKEVSRKIVKKSQKKINIKF